MQADNLFSNTQIEIQTLPVAEELAMVSLEPIYKKVRYIAAGLVAMVLIPAAWAFAWFQPDLSPFSYVGAGLITIISTWIVMYNGISFHYMGYALREKDISFKSGWLWKSMTTVPFNRVQHCDIRQGLLDRQFGLSKITIYTAGGQSADLMIPGLRPETAERLKTYILNSTEQSIELDTI